VKRKGRLKMGKAYYKFRVSSMEDALGGDVESIVQKECSKILTQLPSGTKQVKIETLPIVDLSIHYIAVFEHPIFIEDSEIKDMKKYTRDIGINLEPKDGQPSIYSFDKTDNLNFDEFINKKYPDDN
jgi:hypothetical protein